MSKLLYWGRGVFGITSSDGFSARPAPVSLWSLTSNHRLLISLPQVLQTLGTETYRPSSASQCVAGIACAEIPMNQWPELIPQLVTNVTNQHSTEHMKESTLEAIGYICQDIVSIF